MATPTFRFNADTGSDTAASGAGPATAQSGTKGRTRPTAAQVRVGFFEGSPPDLSGVVTDGSHGLYIGIATGGQRNFSSISAVKDTQQTGADAAITIALTAITCTFGATKFGFRRRS